jgi:quercetin dioxygenase-like cupin family protein
VRAQKPWGYELIWAQTDRYAGKILYIETGCRLSLHFHRRKEETFYLLSGRLHLELEAADGQMEHHVLSEGQVIHIPPGLKHRMRALETCQILEVSTADLEDVVRLQDDFGRAGTDEVIR